MLLDGQHREKSCAKWNYFSVIAASMPITTLCGDSAMKKALFWQVPGPNYLTILPPLNPMVLPRHPSMDSQRLLQKAHCLSALGRHSRSATLPHEFPSFGLNHRTLSQPHPGLTRPRRPHRIPIFQPARSPRQARRSQLQARTRSRNPLNSVAGTHLHP